MATTVLNLVIRVTFVEQCPYHSLGTCLHGVVQRCVACLGVLRIWIRADNRLFHFHVCKLSSPLTDDEPTGQFLPTIDIKFTLRR